MNEVVSYRKKLEKYENTTLGDMLREQRGTDDLIGIGLNLENFLVTRKINLYSRYLNMKVRIQIKMLPLQIKVKMKILIRFLMIKIMLYQALHSWVKDTQTGSLLSLMAIA